MFVQSQNLPQKKIKLVAINSKATAQIDALNQMGVETILIPPCPFLQKGVNTHADMVMFHHGGNKISLYNYDEQLNKSLIEHGFDLNFVENPISSKYPHDISLNSFLIQNYFVGSKIYSKDKAFKNMQKIPIDVKQGYAKCSTAILSENAIISSDIGIYEKLTQHGLRAIHVTTNNIKLEEYNCGFIGGCCAKLSQNKIAFTGTFKNYEDGKKIEDFCHQEKIEIIYLTKEDVVDVGSMLGLLES